MSDIKIIICDASQDFLYNLRILGRYNKLSRKLSQTPWFIGTSGRKRVETSVQDLLCNPIAETLKAECTFWFYLLMILHVIFFFVSISYDMFMFAQR